MPPFFAYHTYISKCTVYERWSNVHEQRNHKALLKWSNEIIKFRIFRETHYFTVIT